MRGGALATLTVRSLVILEGQFFCHDNFRAAGASRHDVEFVHKGAHQEDSAAGSTQKVLLREWIGHVGKGEARAFVQHMDDHFFAGEINGEMNLLLGALLIAVMKCVDDALAYAHANFVTIVLAETSGFGYTDTHLLSKVDAFHLRLQGDFEVLGVCAHERRPTGANGTQLSALIGNTAAKPKSMEHLGFLGQTESLAHLEGEHLGTQKCLFDPRPVGTVEGAILDGFTKVAGIDVFGGIEVGDSSGDFKDAVVGAGG